MAEEAVKAFAERLFNFLLTEETIIDEKLAKFTSEDDPKMIALINDSFFAKEFKLTKYLSRAREENPKGSEPIRKKVINFIANYVETHHIYILEHVKGLFS